jgi:16S rRNA (cytidine1402-2'-O)-methyltransferase
MNHAPAQEDKEGQKGTLYVVATPIGNLEDVTLRALKALKEVQLIAAEDTRRTGKLLKTYQIQTPLISLYDQNELKKSNYLISMMKRGMDIAYVSDAGTPGISDPGYILVSQAIANDVQVVPIPGVSAAIAALSVAGLPMDRFAFEGFLPSKMGKRQNFLVSLKEEERTLVFYESPNRLGATLIDLLEIFGDRKIAVFRELTKVHEEILRGFISEVIALLRGRTIKGEVTLIVAGKEKTDSYSYKGDDLIFRIYETLKEESNLSRLDKIKKIAGETGLSRRKIYQEVLKYEKNRPFS